MSDQPGKQSIRRSIRAAIAVLDRDDRQAADVAIADRVRGLPEWAAAGSVLLYRALPDEVATSTLIAAAFADGKRVFLPRTGASEITFHEIPDEEALDRLTRHRLGIHEPRPELPRWEIAGARAPGRSPTLVVCPGRAFDLSGNRIGRGRGYYDRFLASIRREAAGGAAAVAPPAPPPAIGICYETQLLDRLPADSSDEPMDALVTERRTLRF